MKIRSGLVFCCVMLAALWLMPRPAEAGPAFSANLGNANLATGLGWSSDLGVGVGSETGAFTPDGTPVTVSASAVRDGRTISASITQTAPYVLDGQYWAATWTGTMSIPRPGYYGLFAGAFTRGLWSFDIPGLTFFELIDTTFYYATVWDIQAPADIHPDFDMGTGVVPGLHGSGTGSFTLAPTYYATGNPWFGQNAFFQASTYAQDTNLPGTMNFSYSIAFSTTPIDAGVFTPTAPVPEPAALLMLLAPLAAMVAWRRKIRASAS